MFYRYDCHLDGLHIGDQSGHSGLDYGATPSAKECQEALQGFLQFSEIFSE